MIYFIRNGRCIKVGFSKNVEARMRQLRTSVPELELLGTMPGTMGHEQTIHNLLAPYHVDGEWFRDCPEVREVIRTSMENGVEEWQSARKYLFEDNEWGRRVSRMIEIICADKTTSDFSAIESAFGLSPGIVWQIKYRPREVTVSEYYALMKATARVIQLRMLALEQQADFIRSLEIEDAEADNGLRDFERGYQALVRGVEGE